MTCGPPGCDGFGLLDKILAGLPSDGRARCNNFGKGVMFWENDRDAARFVNVPQLVSDDADLVHGPRHLRRLPGRPPAQRRQGAQ